MSAAQHPEYTTGTLGFWNGTKDGKEATIVDFATGETNLNRPKELSVLVCDTRKIQDKPTLLSNGYQLSDAGTLVTEEQFTQSSTAEGKAFIQDVYFKECVDVIRSLVPDVGEILPWSFRCREQKGVDKQQTEDNVREPEARYAPRPIAHLDRDTAMATTALEDYVGKEGAKDLLAKYENWAQVNVWRPIGLPATKWPLCLLNHDRIPDWSYATHVERLYPYNDPRMADRGGKSYDSLVKPDERYDYYYVSDMTPQECLVFCSFHSDPKLAVPHSAFWDNSTPEDAPNRRSIEVRSLVFF
ncbi:hypothetical protein TI39_contig4417g00004 [Zymoseptoria brevis]|uniref:Methyltransferase like protein n=1 Tax=Zymoseptoria brevis TaxID=1047168 RepID=A0A0F4G6U8_9PEZI|nr:hypothetical protein TI39_contig4417g00004 [Zymoseptoria brevis]